ncbi:hypothetical protein [Novosphingobium sp.]|uniref:hypothetical protein n=1 Tax=Novosphingobium sp. TaxID=1874826 RepID=UPI002603E4A4|nr:hypothetical protein [Novosphingobium sp.]
MRKFGYLTAGTALAVMAAQSLVAAPKALLAEQVSPQTPCMFSKTTDQVFEYRNMQAREFVRKDTRFIAVTGCLASSIPEKLRSVSISFVALDARGEAMGVANGQQLLTPTQTVWFWSNKTPAWTVPAAAELAIKPSASAEVAQWIQVTVFWRETSGQPHTEVYLLSTTPKPLMGDVPPEPVEGERPPFEPEPERGDCQLVGAAPRFDVSNVRQQLKWAGVAPVVLYKADLQVPGHAGMAKAWVIFSAFDKTGNFIGADGGIVGGKIGVPPPPATPVDEGFALRTDDFSKVSKRTLVTFQWYDNAGCRWTENHFVDAVWTD